MRITVELQEDEPIAPLPDTADPGSKFLHTGRHPQWWMTDNASGRPNLLSQIPTPVSPKN
jgi:hypothetical protein